MSGDYYETYIAEYAIHNNIPIIGVCAGFNILERVAGGELVSSEKLGIDEKLHNVYSKEFRHKVDVVKGTVV